MSDALRDVAAERLRQIEIEGWSKEHDNTHSDGQLAEAAMCYFYHATLPDKHRQDVCGWPVDWPWDMTWWKPTDRRRDLVKAAALILAEIERLDRCFTKGEQDD